jgi:nucleotide-binding universal stress UspA family protein
MALALGRDLGLALTLLHIPTAARTERIKAAAAYWETRRREGLEKRIRAMLPSPPPEVTFHSAHGRPKEAILRVAEEGRFDLVVMGCHGGGPLRNLFVHPTSCEVLHGSPCPVWFVPRALKDARVEELVAA